LVQDTRITSRLVCSWLIVALALTSGPVEAVPAPNAWKQQAVASARSDVGGASEAADNSPAVAADVECLKPEN